MTITATPTPYWHRCPICGALWRADWRTGHRHRPPCPNRDKPPSEWTT